MTGFLLDTNVISEAVKPVPNPRVAAWIETTAENLLFLSVLTLGEILKGIAALPKSAKRSQLEYWLAHDLVPRFNNRILSIDLQVAQRWGEIAARASLRGTPMPVIDGLLAATATHFDLTLVTRDTGHLEDTGVSYLNPWQE